MKADRRLFTEEVAVISTNLLELINEQKYRSIFLPVSLKSEGKSYEYITLAICKVSDVSNLCDEVQSFEGADINDYHLSDKYCHITTALRDSDFSKISFDEDDNDFVKAQFSDNYKVVSGLFDRYFEYCDRLLATGNVIDDNLLSKYFLNIKCWYNHVNDNKNVGKRLKFLSNKILKKSIDK